jgi:hypothetical protein
MRIITLLTCFIFTSLFVSAQCTIDTSITHNVDGIYPDTITNLPHSHVAVAYSTDIQFKIAPSTLYSGITVAIDSIKIITVTGLPPGFTYLCTPSNCVFPGGTSACVLLQGPAPTGAMIGSYPIEVIVKGYARPLGFAVVVDSTITGYKIVIDSTTGISDVDRLTFSVGQNTPNPAKEYTNIGVNILHNADVTVTVSNVIGKKVLEHSYNLQRGKNTISLDVHNLMPGIYLYTISEGRNTITRRMIVSND